jgi:hypothetical protein
MSSQLFLKSTGGVGLRRWANGRAPVLLSDAVDAVACFFWAGFHQRV